MVRHKNRYIVTVITQHGKKPDDALILNPSSLYNAILAKVQQLFGDFGVAAIRAGFNAKYCNERTRTAVIRVRHGPHKLVAGALPCINLIENKQVVINILYVGATIKQCFNFLLQYQQKRFDEFCADLKSDQEKLALKEVIMNLDSVLEIKCLCETKLHLDKYDCNVIIMDWSTAARGPKYALAAANTEVVGRELGLLLYKMIRNGLNPKDIHLIGFSLGAHVAACASELLKTKDFLIGRITGLDASSPLFRHNHVRQKRKKLDKGDAHFVDVLHTDASPVFADGFGLWEPIGHVDFFANGGQEQPGCIDRRPSVVVTHLDKSFTRDNACSHLRAFQLFLESIVNKAENSSKCEFLAFKCPGGLSSFQKGQCFPKISKNDDPLSIDLKYRDDIGVQGEDARGNGVMYFVTKGVWPFCGTQLQAFVRLSQKTPSTLGALQLQLQYDNQRVNFAFSCELTDPITRNTEIYSLGTAYYRSLDPSMKKIQAVIKYFPFELQVNKTETFENVVIIEEISVRDMYDNSWQYLGEEIRVRDEKEENNGTTLILKNKSQDL